MSGIEGIGEAISGALTARAVEPTAGEAHGEAHGACLNCGAALAGPYCGQCGQAGHVHRSLAAFWHDLAHGVLHFEGKIWRTLPLLAWRPGELTRRYIEGERAKFVSPIAIFLFSVFMMFAVFSFVGGPFSARPGEGGHVHVVTDPEQARREARADSAAALAALQRERAEAVAAHRDTAAIDARIRENREAARIADQAINISIGAANAAGGRQNFESGLPWLDAAFRHASENPELLFYKLETNAYKFSWALIPISVPFVWLLFLHRRRYWRYKAYDHTVFVTYSIAFMSLALVALSLLRRIGIGDTLAWLAIGLIPPIHIFRQLRGAYRLSVFSALWRTAALLVIAVIASSIFLTLMITLDALH